MARRVSLTGVMVALLTPLKPDGSLDEGALHRLVRHVLASGVTGVCPVGSTGEGPHLGWNTRLRVLELVRDQVGRRVPVIPAITTSVTEQARSELNGYAEAGADAVLVTPPSYYTLNGAVVERFFRDLVSDSPVSIVLYNIPQMARNWIPVDIVGRLARLDNVIGIKDSSRDFEYFLSVLNTTASTSGFDVVTGADTMLLPSLLMGAQGTIAASANLTPELGIGIIQAAERGDWDTARRLQRQLTEVVSACRRGVFPTGWKAALALVGICEPHMAAPTPRLDQTDEQHLAHALARLGLVASA